MKNFSFSILFAFLFIALFASCDNEYNNLNKGNGIFYYGLDNELRGFYGFLKGEQYYFEDHKDYKVCNFLLIVLMEMMFIYLQMKYIMEILVEW